MFMNLRSKKVLINEIKTLEQELHNKNHVIERLMKYYDANKVKNVDVDIELYKRIK